MKRSVTDKGRQRLRWRNSPMWHIYVILRNTATFCTFQSWKCLIRIADPSVEHQQKNLLQVISHCVVCVLRSSCRLHFAFPGKPKSPKRLPRLVSGASHSKASRCRSAPTYQTGSVRTRPSERLAPVATETSDPHLCSPQTDSK